MNLKNRINADTLLSIFRKHFVLLGLWKPYEKSNLNQLLYTIFGGIFLFTFVVVYSFTMVASIFSITKIEELANRLYMSSTEFALFTKIIPIFFFNHNLQKIHFSIKNFVLESPAEERLVKKRINLFALVMVMYYAMPFMAATGGNIGTILSKERKLTYSGVYPGFDWQNDKKDYWIVFGYQWIGILITGVMDVMVDLYYCFAIYFISIEFEVLGNRLSSIQQIDSNKITKMLLLKHFKKVDDIRYLIDLVNNSIKWSYFSQIMLSSIVIFATTSELARVCSV